MQQWDLNLIIRLQQALRNPFFDWFFYIISFIGSEYFLLAFAVIAYWCFSKRFAYKFFNVFLAGSVLTGVFKTIAARPRPYLRGADAVIDKTEGYSFPSGHSQNAANMATQFSLLAYITAEKTGSKKRFASVTATAAAVTLVVMFSRLYLGQHYLTDVVAGAALGVFTAVLFSALFELLKDKEERLAVVILPITVVLAAVLIGINKNPEDFVKLLGVAGAMSLGYFLEKRYVAYEVKSGALFKQIVKVLAGILVVLLIKEGLKPLFDLFLAEGRLLMLADYIRYFLMGIFASLAAPWCFKRFKL